MTKFSCSCGKVQRYWGWCYDCRTPVKLLEPPKKVTVLDLPQAPYRHISYRELAGLPEGVPEITKMDYDVERSLKGEGE